MSSKKQPPVHVVQIGRVRAAVWANETAVGVRHSMTFEKHYLDDQNHWQTSTSYGPTEALQLAEAARAAARWVYEEMASRGVRSD